MNLDSRNQPHHKFKLGQCVQYVPDKLQASTPAGAYKITRLLPPKGREQQYRIKGIGAVRADRSSKSAHPGLSSLRMMGAVGVGRKSDRAERSGRHLISLAKEVFMSDLAELQRLLSEIAGHVKDGTKADKRRAADKLNQLAAIATTMGFTIRPQN